MDTICGINLKCESVQNISDVRRGGAFKACKVHPNCMGCQARGKEQCCEETKL